MRPLNEDLKRIYALLKVDGDFSVMAHLYIDRIDFCSFGNSQPFRIRIVNAFNDNPDYFYVKKADASRVYGLELEHLLSPNRLSFLTSGGMLVEEHIRESGRCVHRTLAASWRSESGPGCQGTR